MQPTQLHSAAQQLERNRLLFQALGDEARQNILQILAGPEQLSVGALALRTELSRPAVSHHIRVLKAAGLLQESRQGTRRYYTPVFTGMTQSMKDVVASFEGESRHEALRSTIE